MPDPPRHPPWRPACRWSLVVLLTAALGCGHAIAPGIPFQHAPRFDFRRPPPCADVGPQERAPAADDDVVLRYLGTGSFYLAWRGEALLVGPFFSNPGLLRVGLGRMRLDREAIRRGLEGVQLERVGAILVGHSHYDHLGDLPVVAALAERATLLVNRSGAHALAGPYPFLASRLRVLEELEPQGWVRLRTARGHRLPFRVLPVPSGHAPHVRGITLWRGETAASELPWHRRRYGSLKAGRPYAFVLDLLEGTGDETAVAFRVYLQDAAAAEGKGYPPMALGARPYDLAVVCVASAQWVRGYPQGVLHHLAPRHVLATHYASFFRPWGPRRGFVPLLTRGVADRFLRRVDATLDELEITGTPPVVTPCGPSSPRWTMPLTGEQLIFRPSSEVGLHESR